MRTFFDGPFENSLYSDPAWQGKNVLIVVPHQDDELNLAGATIRALLDHKIKVRVLFCTNSDRFEPGSLRIQEGIASCRALGLPDEDIIFLGYCNTFRLRKDLHFYNGASDDLLVTSTRGLTETYCLPEKPEFCFLKHHVHHQYTRRNFRVDLQEVLLTYRPAVIFAVDFDRHPDHRALSLLFEEALARILQQPGNTYKPEVYKGFAYNGSYLGKRDFYDFLNLAGEVQAEGSFSNNQAFDTDYPPYDWENRIRLPLPRETLSRTLNGNALYPSIRAHFSQGMLHNAKRVFNSDQVFWRRRTDSLSYQAAVSVTSGAGCYLQDFKLADCPNILALPARIEGSTWIPAPEDSSRQARLTLARPHTVSRIVIYGNADTASQVLAGKITLSTGWQQEFGPLKKGAKANIFDFPPQDNISWVEITLTQVQGTAAGLTEVEIYEQQAEPTFFQYLKIMINDTFAYDYWLNSPVKQVDLQLYTHGPDGVKIYRQNLPAAYTWQAVNQNEDDYELCGSTLIPGRHFHQAVLKVCVAAHPEIYDQIVLRKASAVQLLELKVAQAIDVAWNRLEHVVKHKYYKWFIKEKN